MIQAIMIGLLAVVVLLALGRVLYIWAYGWVAKEVDQHRRYSGDYAASKFDHRSRSTLNLPKHHS